MYVEQCDFNGNVLHHNRCKWNTAVVQLSSVLIDSVECGDSVATGSALCSPVPMFPGTDVPRTYISPVPMFPGTYVPRYLCSPMFVL